LKRTADTLHVGIFGRIRNTLEKDKKTIKFLNEHFEKCRFTYSKTTVKNEICFRLKLPNDELGRTAYL